MPVFSWEPLLSVGNDLPSPSTSVCGMKLTFPRGKRKHDVKKEPIWARVPGFQVTLGGSRQAEWHVAFQLEWNEPKSSEAPSPGMRE